MIYVINYVVLWDIALVKADMRTVFDNQKI